MMKPDKTGAPTTVTAESDRYTIAVEGQQVGHLEFHDRDGQRIFTHTEVDENYEGRGLATILQPTSDAGLQIVAECPTVANYVKKHDDIDAIVTGDGDS
jgi:predicted GNAT family acetyltransferase